MADNTQNARIGKRVPFISSLTVAPMRIISQHIDNWVMAINCAKDPIYPRRRLLNQLYYNIATDGKVTTVLQKSRTSITNKDFVFYKKGDEGTPVDRIMEEIIDTVAFEKLLGHLSNADFMGPCLLEIVPGTETPIGGINLIPYDNYLPDFGQYTLTYMDNINGIPLTGDGADEFAKKFLIEYGDPKAFGLLLQMAQYVIYKRGGFGDWSQFAEIFGMPFRIGEYDPFDDMTRKKLETALANMGGAGYAVIPQGTSIKFENGNSNTGQSAVFSDLIKLCNDEIAQIGLGGTMTTADGSSRSQSETHQVGEDAITKARIKTILRWLNGPFKKRLADYFGYTEMKDGYFTVENEEVISLSERILIDDVVSTKVKIKPDYWYETYGVEMPDSGPEAVEPPVNPAPMENPAKKIAEKKKLKLMQGATQKFYDTLCKNCGGVHLTLAKSTDKEAARIAKAIYDGKQNGIVDTGLLEQTASDLLHGLTDAYTAQNSVFDIADEELIRLMTENVYVFSGFKSYQFLKAASGLLTDEEGNILSFGDFKAKVLELNKTYNVNYLAAEYQHAVACGQMGSKWIGAVKNKADFPNLVYTTAGDERVRPAHAALDGTVQPIDSAFWASNYPPNGWGCRCDADATDAGVTQAPDVSKMQDSIFNSNVGQDGVVFPKDHPYFATSKEVAKEVTAAAMKAMPKQNG